MLKLFNSLTGKTEEVSLPKKVKWYNCGPTIYNKSHIGHARSFITFDVMRRFIESLGHEVVYVMNITDIDDKIINKIRQLKPDTEISHEQYLNFINEMENHFWNDMDKLGNKKPTIITRVSEYIPQMIEYIQKIMDNGYAYPSNGSVYFDVTKFQQDFPNVGLIDTSGNIHNQEEFIQDKRDPKDFALWKAVKPNEISWDSPWGKGRVGWHLECSTMIYSTLGNTIDIHSGGIDLKHLHHNNEFMQSVAFSKNEHWTNYFFHSGHIFIDKEKMSQSIGNTILIDDFLEKLGTARQLRLLVVRHQWNKPIDFSIEDIEQTKIIDTRIQNFFDHFKYLKKLLGNNKSRIDETDLDFLKLIENKKEKMKQQLLDNFNTSSVMSEIMELINATFAFAEKKQNILLIEKVYETIKDVLNIFNLNYEINNSDSIEPFVETVIQIRKDIRDEAIRTKNKNLFDLSDKIRDKYLLSIGIQLEDLKGQTKWKSVNN